MPKEQIEEYIEAIFDIAGEKGTAKTTEVANKLKIAPASVTEVFRNMSRNGLVEYEPYKGVSLTASGVEAAIKIKRKHRLLEVFLAKILHIAPEKVHEEACKMEHSISDEVGDAICRQLDAPARCPDGKLIYPCEKGIETCNECKEALDKDVSVGQRKILPITDMKPCQKGNYCFSPREPQGHSEAFRPRSNSRDRSNPDEKDTNGGSHRTFSQKNGSRRGTRHRRQHFR